MRTTVTLDDDVDAMLRAEIRRTGRPFKEVVNEALRVELEGRGKAIVRRLKGTATVQLSTDEILKQTRK
jgi:hypothetical protein